VPRFRLDIEYDGTAFAGFQAQAGLRTVQGAVEQAIKSLTAEDTFVYACGRTDTGVHAIAMPAHVDIKRRIPPENIRRALNTFLAAQKDRVSILRVRRARPDWHARFDCRQRTYVYRILNRASPPALEHDRAHHVHVPLDARAMRDAARILLGTHDFSSFRAAGCYAESPVKTLDSIAVRKRSGNIVEIEISAKAFLYHQVRNIVGALIEVGAGRWNAAKLAHILNTKSRAENPAPSAPARGLFFKSAKY